jgi:hypothetical protein
VGHRHASVGHVDHEVGLPRPDALDVPDHPACGEQRLGGVRPGGYAEGPVAAVPQLEAERRADQVGLSRRYGITVGSPAGSLWLVMRSVAAASAVVTAKQIRNTSITLRSIVLQPCANGCGRVNGRAARPVSFSGSGGGYGRRHDA